MSKKYEKPEITAFCDLCEGVYASSGSPVANNNEIVCQSRYIKGVWHRPNHALAVASQGTNIEVKGCEGCSADDGDGCKIQKKGELNPYGVFMPTWEQLGQSPTDLTW